MLLSILTGFSASQTFASPNNVGFGKQGQKLRVLQVSNLEDKQLVIVRGKNYNTNLGIYVAFCELPPKGQKPDNCYGGINLDNDSDGSVWVSSNPPIYGKYLAKPFWKGGRFKVEVQVSKTIGNFVCKRNKCGVITRADHTNGDNRSADVRVPVSFK